MEAIEIRPCELRDLPAVRDLMIQLSEAAHATHEFEPAVLEELFQRMARTPEIYLNLAAVAERRVVGFVSVIFYQTFFHRGGTALINELIVDREQRGTAASAARWCGAWWMRRWPAAWMRWRSARRRTIRRPGVSTTGPASTKNTCCWGWSWRIKIPKSGKTSAAGGARPPARPRRRCATAWPPPSVAPWPASRSAAPRRRTPPES